MTEPRPADTPAASAEEIRDWIVARLARLLETTAAEIDTTAHVGTFGLDSVQLVLLVTDLEAWLGVRFTENPLNESTTIEQLARFLAERARQPG